MPRFDAPDGLSLYFEDSGDGPAVLCLAGLTRNCRDFDPLRGCLPDLRLICMDYRGRGLSDHDPNHMNYNVAQEARDAVALLDHLSVEKAVVVGTSRGGLIAMHLAVTAPARLAGVVMNDVGPELNMVGIGRILEYLGTTPSAQTYDAAAKAMAAANAPHFPGVPLSTWRRQAEAQFVETDSGLALRYDARLKQAILEQAATQEPPDMWAMFDALSHLPAAVLRGALSDVLSADGVTAMTQRNPALLAVSVPDRGHAPFLDEPECLTAIETIVREAK